MQLFDPCDVTIVELSTYRAPQFRSCEYIALFFEAVRKSADLADGLIRFFEEIKGVLLSGRYNSPCGSRSGGKWRLLGPKAIFMKKPSRGAPVTLLGRLSSRATFLSLVSMARPGREEMVRQVGSRSRLALGLLGMAFAVLWLPTQA